MKRDKQPQNGVRQITYLLLLSVHINYVYLLKIHFILFLFFPQMHEYIHLHTYIFAFLIIKVFFYTIIYVYFRVDFLHILQIRSKSVNIKINIFNVRY